uniref:Fk506 binding protein n=1 Tax=Rhizophora mucronata TaxID=61149 RepID=A0A2P2MVG0_RHIMU
MSMHIAKIIPLLPSNQFFAFFAPSAPLWILSAHRIYKMIQENCIFTFIVHGANMDASMGHLFCRASPLNTTDNCHGTVA